MVKKKSVKKVSKKKISRKKAVVKDMIKKDEVLPRKSVKPVVRGKRKPDSVVRNLILFFILLIFFTLLYNVTPNELLSNLFWILALLSGFVFVAFVIVWLIFFVLRLLRK